MEEAPNVIKFLEWLKTFEPAQNILGRVKGQGINIYFTDEISEGFKMGTVLPQIVSAETSSLNLTLCTVTFSLST